MSYTDQIFKVREEKIVKKGILDLYVPGTRNPKLQAALVNKSETEDPMYVIVFDRINCEIDLRNEFMKVMPGNEADPESELKIFNSQNIELYALIGDKSFIETIFEAHNKICRK